MKFEAGERRHSKGQVYRCAEYSNAPIRETLRETYGISAGRASNVSSRRRLASANDLNRRLMGAFGKNIQRARSKSNELETQPSTPKSGLSLALAWRVQLRTKVASRRGRLPWLESSHTLVEKTVARALSGAKNLMPPTENSDANGESYHARRADDN